jgi:DNA modification methylase
MDYRIIEGDCIEGMRRLEGQSVNCVVTSPPYFGLRDYGHDGQIGLEETPDAYVAKLVDVFREVRRVLRDDGTLWLNIGDSYAGYHGNKNAAYDSAPSNKGGYFENQRKTLVNHEGIKNKDLIGIPWRVAFALQADGWYLRQDIIWHKPNPMPESVRDRCTKAHEYIFLLSKSERYYFDSDAMQEPATSGATGNAATFKREGSKREQTIPGQAYGTHRQEREEVAYNETRNRRSVWTVATRPYKGAHFATFPPDLIRPCILAGCPPKGKRCDCDEVIASPLGSGSIEDPTMQTGRAGMNRPRRDNEGTRPITRREQRHEAIEMKASPHRAEIERECGPAFAHYIRTDRSGARPLPHDIRKKYMEAGWITEAPSCTHPIEEAGTVLDPFGGSGTTALVALEEGRKAVLCELNSDYIALAHKRLEGLQLRIA